MTWREMMQATLAEQLALWGRPAYLALKEAGGYNTATLTRDNPSEVVVALRAVRADESTKRVNNQAGEETQWDRTFTIAALDLGTNREPREGDELRLLNDDGSIAETFKVTTMMRKADDVGITLQCRRFV